MDNAVAYLNNIREISHRIEILESLKSESREKLGTLKSKKNQIRNNPTHDALERDIINSIAKIEELDKSIAKEQTIYLRMKWRAYNKIMRLKEGQCRRFLIDYYIRGMSEIDIAYEYRYESTVSIYNLKRRAIRYFAETYEKI